jgi:hypothetical protein
MAVVPRNGISASAPLVRRTRDHAHSTPHAHGLRFALREIPRETCCRLPPRNSWEIERAPCTSTWLVQGTTWHVGSFDVSRVTTSRDVDANVSRIHGPREKNGSCAGAGGAWLWRERTSSVKQSMLFGGLDCDCACDTDCDPDADSDSDSGERQTPQPRPGEVLLRKLALLHAPVRAEKAGHAHALDAGFQHGRIRHEQVGIGHARNKVG